jgi:hypothetical protein
VVPVAKHASYFLERRTGELPGDVHGDLMRKESRCTVSIAAVAMAQSIPPLDTTPSFSCWQEYQQEWQQQFSVGHPSHREVPYPHVLGSAQ